MASSGSGVDGAPALLRPASFGRASSDCSRDIRDHPPFLHSHPRTVERRSGTRPARDSPRLGRRVSGNLMTVHSLGMLVSSV